MFELFNYFCVNEFKVYLVFGGGVDFMWVFVEEVDGVLFE